ncbi:hypothetical protein G5I_12063 [Acromyrmex echinatior]|uniref:Uncharacterized protein n=1 Tax=Acromyrmex echinatior TaxID=103372 RepID=F4X1A4_ACREC|nr:hypothetical protein G5I_12063 [Acromyrmex echinatior]
MLSSCFHLQHFSQVNMIVAKACTSRRAELSTIDDQVIEDAQFLRAWFRNVSHFRTRQTDEDGRGKEMVEEEEEEEAERMRGTAKGRGGPLVYHTGGTHARAQLFP